MMGVERFAISFKTAFNGNTHRHVVLGIYHSGRYGALGMSRREDLMYKPLVYKVSHGLINLQHSVSEMTADRYMIFLSFLQK